MHFKKFGIQRSRINLIDFIRITLAGSFGYEDGVCSIAKLNNVAGLALDKDGYHNIPPCISL
jgi:hypothetical protein